MTFYEMLVTLAGWFNSPGFVLGMFVVVAMLWVSIGGAKLRDIRAERRHQVELAALTAKLAASEPHALERPEKTLVHRVNDRAVA